MIGCDYELMIEKDQCRFRIGVLGQKSIGELNELLPRMNLAEILCSNSECQGELGQWLHLGLGPYLVTEVMIGRNYLTMRQRSLDPNKGIRGWAFIYPTKFSKFTMGEHPFHS